MVGNRQATELTRLEGCTKSALAHAALLASCFDTTPEGRTVVTLAENLGVTRNHALDSACNLDFSAKTRMSGADLADGRCVRKGAVGAVVKDVAERFRTAEPADPDGRGSGRQDSRRDPTLSRIYRTRERRRDSKGCNAAKCELD